MKELLDTLQAWQGEGIDVGRAVVVRTFGSAPRPEGAVLLYASDGRIAGSVSGGCVEGAAAEEIEKARADGHARVIRYGISDEQAWDVGLACGGTIDVLVEPAVPARRGRRPRSSRWCRADAARPSSRRSPADSPPADVRPARAGAGGTAGAERWPSTTTAASRARSATPALDAQLVEEATEALRRGMSTDRRARRSIALRRGVPGPAAPRGRRRRRGRPLARPSRQRARLRDRRHRRPGVVRDAGALPRRRSARRGLAGRGRRRDRSRPERRGRRPDPRRQVRRAGHRRGAAPRLPLRRRGRLAQDPGAIAASGCWKPASARTSSPACAGRSGWTSADAPRPRRRSRSWPRSWPSATAAPASPDAGASARD